MVFTHTYAPLVRGWSMQARVCKRLTLDSKVIVPQSKVSNSLRRVLVPSRYKCRDIDGIP